MKKIYILLNIVCLQGIYAANSMPEISTQNTAGDHLSYKRLSNSCPTLYSPNDQFVPLEQILGYDPYVKSAKNPFDPNDIVHESVYQLLATYPNKFNYEELSEFQMFLDKFDIPHAKLNLDDLKKQNVRKEKIAPKTVNLIDRISGESSSKNNPHNTPNNIINDLSQMFKKSADEIWSFLTK